MTKKIWFVDFPTYKYKENVKELASKKGLKIIDARFKAGFDPALVEKNPPKLTLKDQYAEKEEIEEKPEQK